MLRRSVFAVVALAALSAVVACKSEQTDASTETKAGADAGVIRPPGVDKNLAEAITAVAGNGAETSGPPPTGVFGPGAADKELKTSDPPKFTLGNKGAGPTVQFGPPAVKAAKALAARTEVSVRTGPQSAMPTLDLNFSVEPEKPAADAPPGPLLANVKLVSGKLGKDQPGQIPPEVAQQAAKMKGSKAQLELGQSGAAKVKSVELAKDNDDSLALVLRPATDAISLAYMPYPTEPVGVGAFWLVTTREDYYGLDVVSYRMVKLEKIDGNKAGLSINTKRYVAGGQLALPGLPAHKIVEFSGGTQGQYLVPVADTALVQGQLTDVLQLNATVPSAPKGRDRVGLQLQMQTTVTVQAK
jgi:hypothetical protein